MTYNFFDRVKEISHSAFWAWILQSLNYSNDQEKVDAYKAAKKFLAFFGIPEDRTETPYNIHTEYPIINGRLDILVYNESAKWVLIVETKTNSRITKEQPEHYFKHEDKKFLGFRKFIGILDLSADLGQHEEMKRCNFKSMDVFQAKNILEFEASNCIVKEYRVWLEKRISDFEMLQKRAEFMEESILKTQEGLHAFGKVIIRANEFTALHRISVDHTSCGRTGRPLFSKK